MTITYKNSGANSGTPGGSTLTAAIVGGVNIGDALIAFVSCPSPGEVLSVTDNAAYQGNGPGNTYTLIGSKTNGVNNLYCYVVPACYKSGADLEVTATFTMNGLTTSIQVLEYKVRTSVSADGGTSWVLVDSQNAATGTANPSTSVTTVAAVTTIVAAAIGDNTSAPTNGTGFTTRTSGTTPLGPAYIAEDAQFTSAGTYTAAAVGAGTTSSTILAVALTEAPAPYAVQGQPNSTQSGNTMTSDAWPFSQTAGNTNLVWIAWYDTTTNIVSVGDVAGNIYTLVGSIRSSAGSSIFIYQATNISASSTSNTFSVVFSAAVPPYAEVGLMEMVPCTIDPATVSFTLSSVNPAPVGPVTTAYANELMFVYMFGGNIAATAAPFAGLIVQVSGTYWGYQYIGAQGTIVSQSIPYSPAGQCAVALIATYKQASTGVPPNTLFFGSD